MYDPCACHAPLVWYEEENAYYHFFLSCDGTTKMNIWMSEPTSDIVKIDFKCKEKKRREIDEKKERKRNVTTIKTCAETGFLLPWTCPL
jgi:hypothetical protein